MNLYKVLHQKSALKIMWLVYSHLLEQITESLNTQNCLKARWVSYWTFSRQYKKNVCLSSFQDFKPGTWDKGLDIFCQEIISSNYCLFFIYLCFYCNFTAMCLGCVEMIADNLIFLQFMTCIAMRFYNIARIISVSSFGRTTAAFQCHRGYRILNCKLWVAPWFRSFNTELSLRMRNFTSMGWRRCSYVYSPWL